MIRYQRARCESCKRDTPHTKRGNCMRCRRLMKLTIRRLKRQGSPLQSYSRMRRLADDLWSVVVRSSHDGCEMCGRHLPPGELQCAHGISRRFGAVRYNTMNMFALCAACHRRHTPPGPAWDDWLTLRLGEANFRWVRYLARTRGRLALADLKLLVLQARLHIQSDKGERGEWARESMERIVGRVVSWRGGETWS